MSTLRLGLALGSGAARGWAHIGVLRALSEQDIVPHCIAGASVGSLVGAAAASGQLDTLEEWVRMLTRLDVLTLLDAGFRGGMMHGSRVMSAIGEQLDDYHIEALDTGFGAVATDLASGREVWLREGAMLSAVRASCGLPGLFSPTRHQGRWLIDGGVVNPVPVSLCVALGADVVIAVGLHGGPGLRRRLALAKPGAVSLQPAAAREGSHLDRLAGIVGSLFRSGERAEPGILDVVSASINIMQERIARSRMAGEPPELLISPNVDGIEMMDFHRAAEAIAAGRAAVELLAPQLADIKSMTT